MLNFVDYAATKLVAFLKVNCCCRGLQDGLLFCLCFLINVAVLPKKEKRKNMVISHVIHFLQISVCQKMAKNPL